LQKRRDQIQAQMREKAAETSTVLNLREELAGVQASLLAEANQASNSITKQISAAQAVASNLRDQLRDVIVSADLPSDVLMQIFTLQKTAESSRSQYQTLLGRLNELDTQAYLQVADSVVVAEADVPLVPSFPNTRLFLMMGAIIAAGLGVGSAVLLENYVGGFTSSAQAEAVLHAPTIAVVPWTKVPRSPNSGEETTVADLVVDAPLSTFTESIRRLRVGADRIMKNAKPSGSGGVVMITSAVPGEGKTSLALALSRSYQMAGQACLLIDCDLRKPSVHKLLNVERNAGLLDLLNSGGVAFSVASIVVSDPRTTGPVIVGSHRSNSATDHFINGPEFARMIEATRKVFDVIVLDTPPVLPVVDSLYLAELADAVIFVTQWGSTSQSDAKFALKSISQEVREEVKVAVVINQDADDRSGGKYKEYYSQ
ncbi:MAG TPA: AAA family ATPase, partial [Devosia sp.]|nr:AAA family ATPase [Devosia sp.]